MIKIPLLGKNWAASRIAKISQVLVANGFNNVASLAITLHAARKMGPERFGQLGLVIAVVSFGFVFLDSGISVALVRGYNADTNAENREALVGGVLKAKLLQLFVVTLLSVPLAKGIMFFLPEVGSLWTLVAGVVSAALMSLWTSVRSLEQARRNYASFTRYLYILGILRGCMYGFILFRGHVSAISVVSCLYLVPLTTLMAYSLIFNERRFIVIHVSRLLGEVKALKKALLYGAWVAGSAILFAFLSRMPLFFLARRSTPRELGILSAAFTFINAFGLIWDALNTVITPEVSGLQTAESRLMFRNMLFRKLPIMFSVLAMVIVACVAAQLLLLGPQYRGSVPSFLILGSFTSVCMCISINNNLVHAYGVPATLTYMNAARVIICALLLGFWWHLDALNVAVIYGLVMLAGDASLSFYVQHRASRDRMALSLATL